MTTHAFPLRPLLLCAALTMPALAAAQEATDPPAKPVRKEQIVSLAFPGGTLVDYVAAVRAAGAGINIVLGEGGERVQVPAMTLKSVEVEAALDAVAEIASDQQRNVSVKAHRSATGEPIHSVRVNERPRAPAGSSAGGDPYYRTVRVYSLLGPISQGLTPDSILTAIEAGLAICTKVNEGDLFKERVSPADIRYHEDSSLLFVRGTMEQMQLVAEVLANIERGRGRPRGQEEPAEPPPPSKAKVK